MMPYVPWNSFGPSQFSTMVFLEVYSLFKILGILECSRLTLFGWGFLSDKVCGTSRLFTLIII